MNDFLASLLGKKVQIIDENSGGKEEMAAEGVCQSTNLVRGSTDLEVNLDGNRQFIIYYPQPSNSPQVVGAIPQGGGRRRILRLVEPVPEPPEPQRYFALLNNMGISTPG